MARGYPLEAAVLDRQGRRARREAELAATVRAHAQAELAVGEALEALNAHLAQRPTVEGASSVVAGRELKRSAAFLRRHAHEAELLRAAHATAVAREGAARAAVAVARAALGEAHAAEQLLERDRERFVAADRKLARDAEQDELDEQQAARRARPR